MRSTRSRCHGITARLWQRELLPQRHRPPVRDGRLPPQDASTARRIRRRRQPERSSTTFRRSICRGLDRADRGRGDHGGLQCPELLPQRARLPRADGRLPAEDEPGLAYMPPPATGTVFSDVQVEHVRGGMDRGPRRRAGSRLGCGGGKYCPDASVSRGEMAAFLVSTFDLPEERGRSPRSHRMERWDDSSLSGWRRPRLWPFAWLLPKPHRRPEPPQRPPEPKESRPQERDSSSRQTPRPRETATFASPWQLQTALNHPSAVHPGDTIWLRGGTYDGTFASRLNGTPSQPIIVRQYPGERAIDRRRQLQRGLDLLRVRLLHLVLGLRGDELGPHPVDDGHGLDAVREPDSPRRGRRHGSDRAPSGAQFINMVVHDARQGFAFWKEAIDAEIYGCLSYYNGWEAPDRGHGHNIYAQNQTGTKKITDTILFSGFSHNIHIYGSSSAFLNNFDIQGTTSFNAGNLSEDGGPRPSAGRGQRRAKPSRQEQLPVPPAGRPGLRLRPGLQRRLFQRHRHQQLRRDEHVLRQVLADLDDGQHLLRTDHRLQSVRSTPTPPTSRPGPRT